MIKRLLYLFIVGIFFGMPSFQQKAVAQEAHPRVVRSSEKVIIGGKIYYIHIVGKGETLYSISKAYGVPEKEISRENPVLVTGLQAGMVLKIPYVKSGARQHTRQEPSPSGEAYVTHTMKEGETLYSLSRQYHVSVEEILQLNPGLKAEDIPLGTDIRIPAKKVVPERLDFSPQHQEKVRYHVVQPGETLYSIARSYGLTVRDLKKSNKGLHNKIKAGQTLRIPMPVSVAMPEAGEMPPPRLSDTVLQDTSLLPVGQKIVFEPAFPCDTSGELGAGRTWRIAVMMPFYLKENDERSYIDSSRIDPATGKKIRKIIYRDPNWIYPSTNALFPYYQGMMIALDTLGQMGVKAVVKIYDTEKDLSVTDSIIRTGELDSMDLIIGPVYPATLSLVAEYAREKHIPVVSPLSRQDAFLHFNPYAFQCKPSRDLEYQYIAAYLADNTDKNLVIIHSNDSLHQQMFERVKEYFFEAMPPDIDPDLVVIREVTVPPLIAPTDTMNNIRLSLDKYKENMVWVLSDEEGFVSEVVSRLHTHSDEYPIILMGSSTWRYFKNMELEFFFRMNLHLFTNRLVDYHTEPERSMVRAFRERYATDPDEMSFAWDGYDETIFFLSILQRYGTAFEECTGYYDPPLCVGHYHFRRMGWFSGFMNTSMVLLQYNRDFTISKVPFSPERTLK